MNNHEVYKILSTLAWRVCSSVPEKAVKEELKSHRQTIREEGEGRENTTWQEGEGIENTTWQGMAGVYRIP